MVPGTRPPTHRLPTRNGRREVAAEGYTSHEYLSALGWTP